MKRPTVVLTAACLIAAAGFGVAPAEIGSVSAVNQDMQGTPPSGTPRGLLLGNQVVQDELIETSDIGSGQLLFLDQTALTVAPKSKIVLDKYLYDASQQTGEITLTLTRGALRFIGGRISKTSNARIQTPSATIGIRGGMVLVEVDEDGRTRVIQIAGEFTVVEGQGSGKVTLSRPGASAESDAGGQTTFTGIVSSEDLGAFFKNLEGQGDGGSPTNAEADPSTDQVAAVNSGVTGGENRQPVSTSGEQPAQDGGEQQENISQDSNEPQDPGQIAPPPPAGLGLPEAGSLIVFPSDDGTFGFGIEGVDLSEGSIIVDGATTSIHLDNPELVSDPRFSVVEGTRGIWTDPGATTFENDTLDLFFPPSFFSGEIGIADFTAVSDLNPDGQFHAVGLRTEDLEGVQLSFVTLLGDRPVDTGQFHRDDAASLPVNANTADVFKPIGGDLIFAPDQRFQFFEAPEPFVINKVLSGKGDLYLIGSAGQSRAPSSNFDTNFDGRWLYAEIGPNGLGVIDDVTQNSGNRDVPEPGLSRFITSIDRDSVQEQRIGALDGFVSTYWGEEPDYLVLSHVHREGSDGFLNEEADTLGTTTLVTGDGSFPLTLTNFGFAQTYARDHAASGIANEPLPLARGQLLGRREGPGLPSMNAVFTGFFHCDGGDCGRQRFVDPGLEGPLPTSGVYAVSSEGNGGGFLFDDDRNELAFDVEFNVPSSIRASVPGATGGINTLIASDDNGAATDSGGFFTDKVFGARTQPGVTLRGNDFDAAIIAQDPDSSFLIASAGLLGGDSGIDFTPGVDTDPEFARWGRWAAKINVQSRTGGNRLDLTDPGLFVAGNSFASLLPLTGTASYSGLAVAQEADLATGTVTTRPGSFGLTYDFGLDEGLFSLNVPGATGLTVNNLPVNPGEGPRTDFFGGVGSLDSGGRTSNLSIHGRFLGTPATPDGAVGGTITYTDSFNNIESNGIFVGDKLP